MNPIATPLRLPQAPVIQREMIAVYELAAGGDRNAFYWLLAFHNWAHCLDDYVDEPDRPRGEVIGLCALGVVVCSSSFYVEHAVTLAPVLAVVAAQYETSLDLDRALTLREGLRLAGNQVVLTVAYLTGGLPLLDKVNRRLWPVVEQSQIPTR